MIASIESLGVGGPETERLVALDKQGVPTRAALLSELDAITNTVQNPKQDTSNGSLSERFWANAQNLVTFRSRGPQEGSSPVAVLSRVKAHVETDALEAAQAEWNTLPAEIRQTGASWSENLALRMEAFALQSALSDKLSSVDG